MNGPEHKLYNYEVTPPPGVWEKLSAELEDAASGHSFPTALYNQEVVPPATVWNNITQTLDAENAPVAEKRGPVTIPLLRYAAAAAVIAFLAWGGIKLFNNKSSNTSNEVAQQEITTEPKTAPVHTTENTSTAPSQETAATSPEKLAIAEQDARDNAALEASKKTYAKLDMPGSKLKGVSDFYFAVSTPRGFDFNEPEPEQNNIADRYIMLMTPDGNIIRMSKKLGSLVCCVSGEDQDMNCVDQMKKWREKLANSSVGHSSGNFMDILSLLSTLQGNDNQ